jgi:hypothetical protein
MTKRTPLYFSVLKGSISAILHSLMMTNDPSSIRHNFGTHENFFAKRFAFNAALHATDAPQQFLVSCRQ